MCIGTVTVVNCLIIAGKMTPARQNSNDYKRDGEKHGILLLSPLPM